MDNQPSGGSMCRSYKIFRPHSFFWAFLQLPAFAALSSSFVSGDHSMDFVHVDVRSTSTLHKAMMQGVAVPRFFFPYPLARLSFSFPLPSSAMRPESFAFLSWRCCSSIGSLAVTAFIALNSDNR
jgi:hypothetical protein